MTQNVNLFLQFLETNVHDSLLDFGLSWNGIFPLFSVCLIRQNNITHFRSQCCNSSNNGCIERENEKSDKKLQTKATHFMVRNDTGYTRGQFRWSFSHNCWYHRTEWAGGLLLPLKWAHLTLQHLCNARFARRFFRLFCLYWATAFELPIAERAF